MELFEPAYSASLENRGIITRKILHPIIHDASLSLLFGSPQRKVSISGIVTQFDTGTDVSLITLKALKENSINKDECAVIEYGKKDEKYLFAKVYLNSPELNLVDFEFYAKIHDINSPRILLGLPEIQRLAETIKFNWSERTWKIQKKNH